MSNTDDLYRLAETLSKESTKMKADQLDRLQAAAEDVGKSWSGSWLGYQSRVYYRDLQPPPPGARFSMEWGFMDTFSNGTTGDWCKYDFDAVIDAIHTKAGGGISTTNKKQVQKATEVFTESQTSILSILTLATQNRQDDPFLNDLAGKIKETRVSGVRDFVKVLTPSGPYMSRDTIALQERPQVPPHISITAQIGAIRSPFTACKKLADLTRHIASHLEKLTPKGNIPEKGMGTKVFIVHGHEEGLRDSLALYLLRDLKIESIILDEEPGKGRTIIEKFEQHASEAGFAVVLLTPDDVGGLAPIPMPTTAEEKDEFLKGLRCRARQNVILELGFFIGRLRRQNVCALYKGDLEIPSDYNGMNYISLDKGDRKAKLKKELKAAGFKV